MDKIEFDVALLLDDKFQRAFRRFLADVEGDGVDKKFHLPAHITLSTARVDEQLYPLLCARVLEFFRFVPKVELAFVFFGFIPRKEPYLCLVPQYCEELQSLIQAIYKIVLDSGAEVSRHYYPRNWAPHCSLMKGKNISLMEGVGLYVEESELLNEFLLSQAALVTYQPKSFHTVPLL